MTDFLAKLSSPRDWPENWLELRTIDNLLRCSICSEYFRDATVVPACSHNYCSLCIRRYLASNSNSKCPSCPVAVTDTELQNNRIIDEIVKSFLKLRDRLLKVVKENGTKDKKSKQTSQLNHSKESQKLKTSKVFTSVRIMTSQKRQRKVSKSSTSEKSSNNDITSPVLRKKLKRQSENESVTADESSDDDISIIDKPTPQKSPVASTSNMEIVDEVVENEDLVDCPVCGEKIAASKINVHLDTCLTSKDRKENLRSSLSQSGGSSSSQNAVKASSPVGANSLMTPLKNTSVIPQVTKRKPLNKLVYTLLSDKELKRRMKEHGLSTKGDRQTLVKRYQEFTLVYNSECNKARPKTVMEIVRFVEDGEKKKQKLNNGREKLNFERGQRQEDIDKMKDDYVSQNQDEFDRLINQIKSRRKKNIQGETSGISPKSRNKKKPTPLKKKSLLSAMHDSEDETGSNSSADFQPRSQRYDTPWRKPSRADTKRVTRSSTKPSRSEKSSDTTPDQTSVHVSDEDSGDSKKMTLSPLPEPLSPLPEPLSPLLEPPSPLPEPLSPLLEPPSPLPDPPSPVPEPPSPSLLNNLSGSDSEQNSSTSESLLTPAFGPSSPTSKINKIQGTPGNIQYDSDEF